jgi:hypothetical protein
VGEKPFEGFAPTGPANKSSTQFTPDNTTPQQASRYNQKKLNMLAAERAAAVAIRLGGESCSAWRQYAGLN